MKALLFVAHGSRNAEANEEVRRMAASLQDQAGTFYGRIEHAFLEIADPAVSKVIEDLIKEGIDTICIFPFFLAGGTHVATDIPALVSEARKAHPHVRLEILPHVGALEGLPSLILQHINPPPPDP